MKLSEIIALAKAGYKKADIEDLLTIEVDEPEPEPDPKSTEPDTGSEGDPDPSPEPSPETDPDYAELYKNLQSEFDKLKEDLKIAQENNKRNPAPDDGGTDKYDLGDVLRGYM